MSSTNQAVSFIQNRTKIGDLIEFDELKDSFVPAREDHTRTERVNSIWEEANREKEALFKAISDYLAKKNQGSGDFHGMEWNVVFEHVNIAVKQYTEIPIKGAKGRMKAALHKIQTNGKAMEQWCNLLPAGDYGSGIAGVFQIMVTSAERMEEVRDCIIEAMEDIPGYIKDTQDYLIIYKENKMEALQQRSAELCTAILILLRKIIHYLTKSSSRRAFGVIGKGDAFEKDLDQAKKRVEKLAGNMRSEARKCEAMRSWDRDRQIQSIARSTIQIGYQQESIQGQIHDIASFAQNIYKLLESNPNIPTISDRAAEQSLLQLPSSAQVHPSPNSSPYPSPCPSPVVVSRPLKRKTIIHLTRGSLTEHARALPDPTQLIYSVDTSLRNTASWVTHQPSFRTWLSSPSSSSLLINGNDPDAITAAASPLQLVAAQLVQVSLRTPKLIGMSAFWDHLDVNGRPLTAAGVIISLIGQLATQCREKNISLDSEAAEVTESDLSVAIEKKSVRKLCKIFKRLVEVGLGRASNDSISIICISDGITTAEMNEREDFIEVMSVLVRLTERGKRRRSSSGRGSHGHGRRHSGVGMFKLLLTSPNESFCAGTRVMERAITVDDALFVPEETEELWYDESLTQHGMFAL